jgi:hypothetical protein
MENNKNKGCLKISMNKILISYKTSNNEKSIRNGNNIPQGNRRFIQIDVHLNNRID